jgi:FixJ family two-component response regulator
MPGMSGPDLFEHMKRQQSPVPVIFITAHGNGDLCARLMKQGAAACLFKPFEPIELVEALRAALPGN